MWGLIFIVNLNMPGTGLKNLHTSFHEIISTTFWCGLIIHPFVSLRTQSLKEIPYLQFSSVQLLSCVWLCVTPWIAACQASLSITNSRSLFKLTSIELVMPSNHLILCLRLLLPPSIFPSIRVFSRVSSLHHVGVSALSSVLSLNIQDWFPLGWTGWIFLQSKGGLLRVFSTIIVQKHQFFGTQFSL